MAGNATETVDVDIFTRNNCINILYDEKKNQKIIDQYSDAIISLTKGDVKQIHIAMQYIMAQLQLESNNRASFNLNNKEFYEQIRKVISSKENEIKSNHDKELSDMWDILELQDEYISSKTGYNIK